MAGKVRIQVDFPPEVIAQLEAIAKADQRSLSGLVVQSVREYTEAVMKAASGADAHSPVDYLLRPGKPSQNWEGGGGRWFLDWLVRSEPDWQRQHIVMLPRHWPLRLDDKEERCHQNGGGDHASPVNAHLSEMRGIDLPADFPDLTEPQWLAICEVYRGCCGERLRAPNRSHWDAICPLTGF